MGSAPSSQNRGEDEDDDDPDEESSSKPRMDQVIEQSPEFLPCYAPATPISAASTPRVFGSAVRVWDPCNVLIPPPPPPPVASEKAVEVFLISHGECGAGIRPDLVGGRWAAVGLTGNGERQARALAVFLNSQGVRFGDVYSSPLDRARATAALVCRELDFAEEHIQSSDALVEISQGQWECCHRSEIYTPEIINLIDRNQSDFTAPSGESLRQVQFRMIEFLNRTVLRFPDKLSAAEPSSHRNDGKELSRQNSVQDRDPPHWDMLYRPHRQVAQRKKSRLQFVNTGDNEMEDEFSSREANTGNHHTSTVGIFSHATPIKCLLTGILDCSPAMSNKIWINDSSVTVLMHSIRTGWQVKRLNDTSHLRLL